MTSPAKNLLLLRLDALHHDVTKVDAAVARAEQRGQYLRDAYDQLKLHIGKLRTVENTLSALVNVMKDDPTDVENLGPKIRALLEDAAVNLSNQLDQAEPLTKDVLAAISRTLHSLNLAMATTVSLKDPEKLKASLNRRCRDLKKELQELRSTVAEESTTATRPHWETYQKLLDEKARPIFVEYVDFLGGLTVRDTGLDDLVCEMTEALLLRYNSLTKRSLPLPGRQAALGNALESVVLLGFPEWSIWGIPLVGHEVGLAYAKEPKEGGFSEIINRFATKPSGIDDAAAGGDHRPNPSPSEELVQQLLADVFATYTLGLSYACAALLLRLSPRHDEPDHADRPRDIDRARVILMTLESDPSAPAAGGSYTDCVAALKELWMSAVVSHAEPDAAELAQQEAKGPPPADDWLDDLTREAIRHFEEIPVIQGYDNDRWVGSDAWRSTFQEAGSAEPQWSPADDNKVVLDVLTAAWRLRLVTTPAPSEGVSEEMNELAQKVKDRWSARHRKGS